MKRVLIIGSSGMLGTDLCQKLRDSYELYGTDLLGVRGSGLGVSKFYKSDITKKRQILEVVKKIQPDVVIHAAAMTDVDGCESDPKRAYSINSEGTKNVALACKAAGSALVYISTDFVFDGKKKKPYKETDRVNPLSIYGNSKLKGEENVKKILKKYFILRTSWLYGSKGKNFVDTIVEKAKSFDKSSGLRPERSRGTKKEKCLRVVNDQVGSPTYTKDLAKAIHKLIDKISPWSMVHGPWTGIYHVSNSGSVSWFDYAKEILRLAKLKTKVISISSQGLNRPAKRPMMSVLDNSKFIKFTGYKMRNWQEALKDYV